VLFQVLRGRIGTGLRLDLETFLLKNFAQKLQNQRIVFHYQNQPARKVRARRRNWTHELALPELHERFSGMIPLLIWYEQRLVHKFIFDTGLFDNVGRRAIATALLWLKCPPLLLADPD
jgi:hypothetical protein